MSVSDPASSRSRPASLRRDPTNNGSAGDEPLSVSSALTELRGVGPKRAAALAGCGYRSIGDLLFHLPTRYEDRRTEHRIDQVTEEGLYLLRGRLTGLRRVRVRRRGLSLVRGEVDDGSGRMAALWFNRPYLPNQVDEQAEYHLYGQVRATESGLELFNATCERSGDGLLTGRVVPIYPSIETLSGGVVRGLIRQILERVKLEEICEPLPPSLLEKRGLPPLSEALVELHEPSDGCDVSQLNEGVSSWHQRLTYGEFLELQIEVLMLRKEEIEQIKPHSWQIDHSLTSRLLGLLPFELTSAQKRSWSEIRDDLVGDRPMLRLLQGDVGSGKTVVAALALAAAAESGLQSALMVPTEILAEQHFRSLNRLLADRYSLALLSRSSEGADEIRRQVASGDLQILVGTQALIQNQIQFSQLGLAVVDEQHRFGVVQRKSLQAKGERPDLLVMTATPIPRSLALTVYGDLALSIIDEMPPGRAPVATEVRSIEERDAVYSTVRERLEEGGQAYVVVPLVKESRQLDVESIDTYRSVVEDYLSGYTVAVLHGQTAPDERQEIVSSFVDGEIDILLATSVIEVGLDVADASIMVIENAERFGLAQLHQLRGRVGRGNLKSFCFALHGRLTPEAQLRLEAFESIHDGFEIAEADLQIRGPGDLLGTRQSGIPNFRLADLVRDRAWLEFARSDALAAFSLELSELLPADYLARIRDRALRRAAVLGGA